MRGRDGTAVVTRRASEVTGPCEAGLVAPKATETDKGSLGGRLPAGLGTSGMGSVASTAVPVRVAGLTDVRVEGGWLRGSSTRSLSLIE